jgi:aspartate/methionine/tyrosine aminotransferase
MRDLAGFSIDRVAAAAEGDPAILRLENLDTDLKPPRAALDATRAAIENDDANSYLPFTGHVALRQLVVRHVSRLSGVHYDANSQCVITAGGTEGLLNALLAILDPGDEVILTDPTYAGMIYRVRLAGGVPRFVPLIRESGEWRLELDKLASVVSDRTKSRFIMNPSMPSGAVLNQTEWEALARVCTTRGLLLLYNAAMERILYDGRAYLHPARLPGMAERTITVGSVSKEYRMIGWRVGWVVGPQPILDDVARVGLYNVVSPVGIAQGAAAAALSTPESDLAAAIAEWQRRRNAISMELKGLPLTPAAGGWSMLLDISQLGVDSVAASDRLLRRGKIAATPMRGWGAEVADQFVRLVFSNEPVSRLAGIGERVRTALLQD